MHDKLKLTIEPVPSTAWGKNIRELFPKDWEIIRRIVYAQAGFKCEICGGKGVQHPIEIHEVWNFDDRSRKQTLERLEALCPSCHSVKHMGFAINYGKGEEAFKRFVMVNGLSETTAKELIEAVFTRWAIRSRRQWVLDVEQIKKKVAEQTKHKIQG